MIIFFNIWKIRKFFPVPSRNVENRGSAGDRGIEPAVRFNGDDCVLCGELTDDLVKQLCFQGDLAFFRNFSLYFCFNSHFHVVGSKFDLIC